MWGLISGTCIIVISVDRDDDEQARREAVCVVRLALLDAYDYIESISRTPTLATELRTRLNRILPDEKCTETIKERIEDVN